jgi:chromosome segregation ATPase
MSGQDFLEIFKGQINKLNDIVKQKTQDFKDYTLFMNNLLSATGGLATTVKKLNEDLPVHLSKYGKDLEDSNKKISDLQSKLAENQSSLDENNKEKQDLTSKMVDLNNEIISLKSQISDLQSQIEQVKAQAEIEKTEIKNQMADASKSEKEEL